MESIPPQDFDNALNSFREEAQTACAEFLTKTAPEVADSPELKEAIRATLDITSEQQRIKSAFESIFDYCQHHCTPVEMQEVSDNWEQAFERFTTLLEGKEWEGKQITEEDLMKPLQTQIGLSPKTYELFYAAGRDLYDYNAFEKAADIFFLLTTLNPYYSNVWLSLGLAEQKCGRFETALKAYAMGAITNLSSPESFLYAADCCIAMNNLSEAKVYLEEGMERINKDQQYEPFSALAAQIAHTLR